MLEASKSMTSVEGALDTCHEALRVARLRCRACRGPQRCSAARRPRRTPPRATSRCREASVGARSAGLYLVAPARRAPGRRRRPARHRAGRSSARAPRLVAGQGDAGRRPERRGRAVQRQAEKPGACGRRRKRRPARRARVENRPVRVRPRKSPSHTSDVPQRLVPSTDSRRTGRPPPRRRSAREAVHERLRRSTRALPRRATPRWCCTSGWCSGACARRARAARRSRRRCTTPSRTTSSTACTPRACACASTSGSTSWSRGFGRSLTRGGRRLTGAAAPCRQGSRNVFHS